MRTTPIRRLTATAAVASLGLFGLAACEDDDGDEIEQDVEDGVDDIEEDVEDGVDDIEEDVEDGVDEVEEEIDGDG